jgi:hypothetical protein
MKVAWIANTSQGRMVADYISTSFTGDGKAHGIYIVAKPPTGSTFSERAAASRFDVTAPPRTVRTPESKVVYRRHNRPQKDGFPTAN